MDRQTIAEMKERLAIVILAYADYESLELALASHARFSTDSGVKIYILQNGRGSYDCERTYSVAQRYHYLYPETIFVVDDISPDIPFRSLKALFRSERFAQYDFIIKLDDDVMVLTDDWIDKLCSCYLAGKQQFGDKFAYATSLINNNPYGFKKIIEHSETLANEYFSRIARKHLVGASADDAFGPLRIMPKEEIYAGSNGTIWRYPYIARWLHENTTLKPQWYVDFASQLKPEQVNGKERYSINCLLFEKKLWTDELSQVEPECVDDEHLLQAYCLKYNKKILADLSIPMVHLFFFTQRNECKDMIGELRACYTDFLGLPFPISLCSDRLIEIENRLRFAEQKSEQALQQELAQLQQLQDQLQYLQATTKKRFKLRECLLAKGLRSLKSDGLVRTIKHAKDYVLGESLEP